MFEVIVGNVGSIYYGNDSEIATERFDTYMDLSLNGYGRTAYETVTLMKDEEIIRTFIEEKDKEE